MPQEIIGIGATPDDGLGDPAYIGGEKINQNFTELYTLKADKTSPGFTNRIDLQAAAFSASLRDDGTGKPAWFVGAPLAPDGSQVEAFSMDILTGAVSFGDGIVVTQNVRANGGEFIGPGQNGSAALSPDGGTASSAVIARGSSAGINPGGVDLFTGGILGLRMTSAAAASFSSTIAGRDSLTIAGNASGQVILRHDGAGVGLKAARVITANGVTTFDVLNDAMSAVLRTPIAIDHATNFITFAGDIAARTGVSARDANASYGWVGMRPSGDALNPGYLEFNLGSSRVGYLGFTASTGKLRIHAENGYTGWEFTQRPVFNGQTPYDTGNLLPFTGDTGTGGGAGLVPAPPAGSAALNHFLNADGTFKATPAALPSTVLLNAGITASVAANALTINLRDAAGNAPSAGSPVVIPFRSATANSGVTERLVVSAAASIIIPSTATLGTVNGVPFNLYLVAFNDAGTMRLGVIQCLNGDAIRVLGAFDVDSAVSIAGGSNLAHTFYAGATITSKAYTVLGRLCFSTGQAAAGTWATAPDRIEVMQEGFALPGDIITRARTVVTAHNTYNFQTPVNNTIPTTSNGAEIATAPLAVKYAAARVRYEAIVSLFSNTASAVVVLHAHFNAVANAIAATVTSTCPAVGNTVSGTLEFLHAPGAAGAHTYKLRAGANTGAFYTGGYSVNPYFGGTYQSVVLKAEEIMT